MKQVTRRAGQVEKSGARRRWSRKWLGAGAVAVVAAAVATTVVSAQQPAKKTGAGADRCWGALTTTGLANDVDGPKVQVSAGRVTVGWNTAGGASRQCRLEWTDAAGRRFTAEVGPEQGQYASALAAASTPAGQATEGKMQRLAFGAGIKAFVNGVGAVLDIPCTSATSLYVSVGTSTSSSAQPGRVEQQYVDAAYRIARAAVRQIPCTSGVTFTATAPAVG